MPDRIISRVRAAHLAIRAWWPVKVEQWGRCWRLFRASTAARLARSPLLRREPWWAEFWAAIGAGGFGLWSMLAAVPLSEREVYKTVTSLGPDEFWQASGLTLAVLQLLVLLYDGALPRRVMCFAATWWWSVLLLALVVQTPSSPPLAWGCVMCAINFLSLVRLKEPTWDGGSTRP